MNVGDDIYLIKDTDPLGGNADSIDNLPHKQLDSKIRTLAGAVDKTEEAIAERARVFFSQPVGPYVQGDLWIDDGILYQSQADRGDGEYVDDDWVWCIRSNVTTLIESTNGDVFKPGQTMSTVLLARSFRNGVEITNEIPESRFRWRRASFLPQPPPNDDATWNSNHVGGYKSIEVTAQDVYARATYFCDILA